MVKGYEIKLDQTEKTMTIAFKGSASDDDVMAFMDEYKKTLQHIKASEFTLQVDCTNMDLVPRDMIPKLESAYTMYKEAGFKKVVFQIKDNPVLSMQLKRIAKNIGLTNSEVIAV